MSPTAYDDWLGRTRGPRVPLHVRALLHGGRSGRITRTLMVLVALFVGAITMAGPASATWSIVGTDPATGQVGAAVASCTDARDLTTTMALVPSVGGAVSVGQAADTTPILLASALRSGATPQQVTNAVQNASVDAAAATRQYGVAVSGVGARAATGADTAGTAGARVSRDGSATVQGNRLASPAVLDDATRAFDATSGPLATRLLAALDAGAAAGGDRTCGAKARSASVVVIGSGSALFVPAATTAGTNTDASTTLLAAKDLSPAELSARLAAESVLPAPRGARAPLVYLSTVVAPGEDALGVLDARYTAQVAASARRAAPAASEDIVDPNMSSGLTTVALIVFALIGLIIAALIIAGLRRADRRAAVLRENDEAGTVRKAPYRGEVTNLFDLDLTTTMRRRREAERQPQKTQRSRESVWSGSSW